MGAQADLFPPDRRLQARMVTAAVLTPLLVVTAVAALVVVMPTDVVIGLGVVAVLGAFLPVLERLEDDRTRVLAPAEEPALHGIVQRLCVVADLPVPELVLHDERQPNSWVVDPPLRRPRLHVTRGLLDTLTPVELEAVVAHELAHVANRDAAVMTVVGLPGAALREGSRTLNLGWWPLVVAAVLGWAIATLSAVGTNALSRTRELSADAAAARMTGRPSALALALRKLSDELAAIPAEDLRAVAARDAFHLLPVDRDDDNRVERALRRGPLRRLGATHPSVEQRIAALDRIEQRLQTARPGLGPRD